MNYYHATNRAFHEAVAEGAGTAARRRWLSGLARPKVLFLHPKTLVDSWPFPVDSLGEVVKAPSAVYPVLAGVVSHMDLELEIFDGYVARTSFSAYKARLRSADVLAITVMSPLKALDTEVTLRLARRLNPNVIIVLGGNQASSFADEWLERGADFVVVGEGEVAFRRLMEELRSPAPDFAAVPNLAYCEAGEACRSRVRADQIDLDESARPRWDLVDLAPYELGTGVKGYTATVEVSRGCPHRCDFCSINTFWGHKQRYKRVERVCEELEALHRLGVRQFIFADDNFGQDHRHMRALFEAMIARDLKMGFGSFMRGDTVLRHPELIELASRAGMRFCLMGIETLDGDWLKSHRKGVRASDAVAMYSAVYDVLNRNGIFLLGLFINPPEGGGKQSSNRAADGLVCDFHYTADLVALKGSGMYKGLEAGGAVGKDMFYHDWNLGSIVGKDGKVQRSTTNVVGSFLSNFALKSMVSGSHFSKRFRRRHLGILFERLLCTTPGDMKRYRTAMRHDLSLAERQKRMLQTVLSEAFIDALARQENWLSPLSLRNGALAVPALPFAARKA